jgi:hypothetical protein
MTDYWLSKLFFELREPELRDAFKVDPEPLFDRFHISEPARRAVRERDVAALAPLVNPYLLRYYCGYIGMPDEEFLAKIKGSPIAGLRAASGG